MKHLEMFLGKINNNNVNVCMVEKYRSHQIYFTERKMRLKKGIIKEIRSVSTQRICERALYEKRKKILRDKRTTGQYWFLHGLKLAYPGI